MINVRALYLGNEAEAYILDDFIDGINIINSDDNHVGKTIVMQSIMFAMGSEAMFPHNFKPKEYVFIIDLDVDGEAISILRSRDTFAIKKRDELVFEESKRDFDEFWSDNICALPSIIKDGKLQRVGLPLFNQLSFVNQTPRNTSSLIGSYYKKDDFKEMVFAIVGLDARQLDSQAERELKDRKGKLKTRRKELAKLVRDLRESGTSLAAISPTADREETSRFVEQLDKLKNDISERQKLRNHAYVRMKKNEQLRRELGSLNRELKTGSIVCLDCGSKAIGYSMPESNVAFDITTQDMRQEILRTIDYKIDDYVGEVERLEKEIRELQIRFNALAETREISLIDIISVKDDYGNLEEMDRELTAIIDEIEDIDKKLEFSKNVDAELRKDRNDFMRKVLISMNHLREVVNDGIETEDYDDLFTTNNKPYTGSEATEFYLARVYSLAKHVKHQLPIVIDSFRAEELSTRREDLALPLYEELQNQVILSATLKGQEAGKYDERTDVHSIDFSGYAVNHLLSEDYVEQFMRKLESFNVKLNVKYLQYFCRMGARMDQWKRSTPGRSQAGTVMRLKNAIASRRDVVSEMTRCPRSVKVSIANRTSGTVECCCWHLVWCTPSNDRREKEVVVWNSHRLVPTSTCGGCRMRKIGSCGPSRR